MRTLQQGPGIPAAEESTTSGRRRRRPGPSTKSERANARALWERALVLGAGRAVAGPDGRPPRSMAAMLLRASRARLQGNLFRPLRLDDRYLFRIVSMKERDLLRRAERIAARLRAQADRRIPPQD